MSEVNIDVERIVREVMARLDDVPPAAGSRTSNAAGELRLLERLITLETLEKRLSGVRRVVVPPRAVVTPAVRDRLRELGIAIEVESSAAKDSRNTATTLIAWGDASVQLNELNNLLAADGVALRPCGCPDLPTAVGTVSRSVTEKSRLGLIVTEAACAALCLANRRPGVQAILAHDPAGIECAARNLAANVLIVPPGPSFQQRRLIAAFCRAPRGMHQTYRKHLT